jgi:prepilin-type processing-associated H-X9-DG protein
MTNGELEVPGIYMKRLGARHGKKTANGANAYTNMAFFDGHVGLYPTVQFNTGPAASPQWPADKFTQDTIFWLGNQKGK